MTSYHRIAGNEAWDYAAHRLSPAHGSIHLYHRRLFHWRAAIRWVRWWHLAALALSLFLLLDRMV